MSEVIMLYRGINVTRSKLNQLKEAGARLLETDFGWIVDKISEKELRRIMDKEEVEK